MEKDYIDGMNRIGIVKKEFGFAKVSEMVSHDFNREENNKESNI